MKIKSINIVGFGGIKNKQISFQDGFNVIYGDNENGKTTVMSFIKMMFYGSGRNVALLSKSPRKKYTPWDGGIMAGSVDFTLNSKNYRLEREFRSSDSTDKITLIDLDLGTREAAPSDIGAKLFGLSLGAFERSVFIGQTGAMDSDESAEGEINSKLSNIVSTADESVSFDTVNSRLEDAKHGLTTTRKAGIYDKNLKLLAELKNALAESEKIYSDYETFRKNADEYRNDIAVSLKHAAEIKAKIDNENVIRSAEKLREMLELKVQLDSLNEQLRLTDGGIADENFVKKLNFCIDKVENAEIRLNENIDEAKRIRESIELSESSNSEETEKKASDLANELSVLQKEYDEIKAKIILDEAEYNKLLTDEEQIKQKRKKFNPPLVIVSAVGLLASVGLYFVNPVIAGAVFIVSLILLVLGFVIRPSDIKGITEYMNTLNEKRISLSEIRVKETQKLQEITSVSTRLEAINTAINMSEAMLERQKALLGESEKDIERFKAAYDSEKEVLFGLYGRLKTALSVEQIKSEIEGISANAAKQKEIKQQLNYIAKDLGNISYEEANARLQAVKITDEEIDYDSLKREYEAISADITERREKLASAEATAKHRLESAQNPESIKLQIAQLEKNLESQKEFIKALDISMEALQESFVTLRRGFGSVLEKKAGEIFAGLTNGRYEGMQISKSFDINVEKAGVFGGKESGYLSNGTADQAYLSLRLALSSLIFESSEGLPILLDDSLAQYDDIRTKTAIEYLKEYSKDEQIIMFTCHGAVYDMAQNSGAEVSKL